ncbi:MAG: hypothetical protein U0L52_01850 [Bacteroidaceae bacterium]|nr:hypothetical protein [Bacteroidaceae bacterium]
MTFEERIKALQGEVEALKTIKRKNSTTLRTITKSGICTGQLKRIGNAVICILAGAIAVIPTNPDEKFIFSCSLDDYSTKKRQIETINWFFDDGAVGICCIPRASGTDNGMAVGATKNVSIRVYVTATSDFTLEASQIVNDEA